MKLEVPDEMRAQFEDALSRACMVCGHAVRGHVSASRCPCCAKGVMMPSEVVSGIVKTVEGLKAEMKAEARRRRVLR